MELCQNENFHLYEEKGDCVLVVHKANYPLKKFTQILKDYPRIKITRFMDMSKAFQNPTGEPVIIGQMKPLADIEISPDKMSVKLKLNATEKEMEDNREIYTNEVNELLHSHHIHNWNKDTINSFPACTEVEIAKGTPPIHGQDAQIKYFTLSERKPVIKEDGKVDFFMNLVDQVDIGDWLGEKIPSTKGTNGMDVFGNPIPAKPGKDCHFKYDPTTVEIMKKENGHEELRATQKGVVKYKNGKISIGKLLIIKGDVGVKTGNIHFNGSVTVTGIVQEGFSVLASEDISIEGDMGVSGFKSIESQSGDVYIKGGASGKSSRIIAGNNVYIKFINECTIEAEGDIHLGLYAYGSILKAKNLLGDENKGKIVGGEVEVEGKVVCAYIGNDRLRKTVVKVKGINRTAVTEELSVLLDNVKKVTNSANNIKAQIENFAKAQPISNEKAKQLYTMKKGLDEAGRILSELERKRKTLKSLLEIKGDGEVSIIRQGFPMTVIQIKDMQMILTKPLRGTYYAEGETLQFDRR